MPGLAEITVRVQADRVQANKVRRVTVQPVRWDAGIEGAPPPDEAVLIRGEAHLYSAELWLMTGGSYSVYVRVEGANGSTMTWEQETDSFVVVVRTSDGLPATLEPYMGMLSHAAVLRDDGAVFVHLHPSGTISIAAQQLFAQQENSSTVERTSGDMRPMESDTAMVMEGSLYTSAPSGVVSFPYAFPQPGQYRLWVQVKHKGKVLTGVFDTEVAQGQEN